MKRIIILSVAVFITSCASINKIITDKSLCSYNYHVEKMIDTTKYSKTEEPKLIGKNTTIEFDYRKKEYFVLVTDSLYGIRIDKFLFYDINGKITYSDFTLSQNSAVGQTITYDESGRETKIIDHEEGWNICWEQAVAIAKKVSKYNRCKLSDRYLRISRSIQKTYKGRENVKLWGVGISFKKYNGGIREVLVDGETGEVVGILRIEEFCDPE